MKNICLSSFMYSIEVYKKKEPKTIRLFCY